MSDEYGRTEPQSSRLAGMFGFVTPQDRAQWEQTRQMNKPRVSAVKQGVKSSLDALMHTVDKKLTSQLRATDQVAAQEAFEETNTRSVNKRWDSKTQSIVETVDYEPLDDRQVIEPDFEL